MSLSRFPLISNQGYIPSSFTCKDYLTQVNDINVVSGSIVSGSFQGYDQTKSIRSNIHH